MKRIFLDFGFSLSKKQKTVAAKENEKGVVSEEDDDQEARGCFFGCFSVVSAIVKKSPFFVRGGAFL